MKLEQNPSNDIERLKIEYHNRALRLAVDNRYSLFNSANFFILQQRQRELLDLISSLNYAPLSDKRILDLGSGGGGVLLELLCYGAINNNIFGTDLLIDRLLSSHLRLPTLNLSCADGQNLPYLSNFFDIVLQFTVFSSILDRHIKAKLAAEMVRVLKPDGLIIWYDFWLNPSNKQTLGIRPPEIRELFNGCEFEFRRVTLAPPISRRLIRISWLMVALLEKFRIFNTHYLVAIRPKPG